MKNRYTNINLIQQNKRKGNFVPKQIDKPFTLGGTINNPSQFSSKTSSKTKRWGKRQHAFTHPDISG